MRSDRNTLWVGGFVVVALVLAAGGLVALAGTNLFSPSSEVTVLIDESVSGLQQGAAVKLRGVKIGEVASVGIACELDTLDSVVVVTCSIESGAITDHAGRAVEIGEGGTLQEFVEKGLRAQVALAGITGLRFLALDFYDPDEHPIDYPDGLARLRETELVIPAIPSTIYELTESVAEILTELQDMQLSGSVEQFRRTLAAAEETMNAVTEISDHAKGALSRVEEVDLRALSRELTRTLQTVRDTTREVGWVVGSESGLDRQVSGALEQISRAASAVARLAGYLERNPKALLAGRKS